MPHEILTRLENCAFFCAAGAIPMPRLTQALIVVHIFLHISPTIDEQRCCCAAGEFPMPDAPEPEAVEAVATPASGQPLASPLAAGASPDSGGALRLPSIEPFVEPDSTARRASDPWGSCSGLLASDWQLAERKGHLRLSASAANWLLCM